MFEELSGYLPVLVFFWRIFLSFGIMLVGFRILRVGGCGIAGFRAFKGQGLSILDLSRMVIW